MKLTQPTLIHICQAVVVVFMLHGMLTDFGVLNRFNTDQIYTFAYLGFGVATYCFLEIRSMQQEENKTT